MANEWIKARCDIFTDPAVIHITERTGLDEYAVVGRLLKTWAWFSSHTADGNAHRVTPKWLDRYVDAEGFAEAMQEAGWLVVSEGGISAPKFERHMSKTAKQRALTANRVAAHRNGDVTQQALQERNGSVTREEERRDINPQPPTGAEERKAKSAKKQRTPKPDHDAEAAEVVRHYQNAVKPGHKTDGAQVNVVKLLKAGSTPEQLRRAADRYAADAQSKDPQFRTKARNFYGAARCFEAFLTDTPASDSALVDPVYAPGRYPYDGPTNRSETPDEYKQRMADLNVKLTGGV